jgi:hypothetical protein
MAATDWYTTTLKGLPTECIDGCSAFVRRVLTSPNESLVSLCFVGDRVSDKIRGIRIDGRMYHLNTRDMHITIVEPPTNKAIDMVIEYMPEYLARCQRTLCVTGHGSEACRCCAREFLVELEDDNEFERLQETDPWQWSDGEQSDEDLLPCSIAHKYTRHTVEPPVIVATIKYNNIIRG